MESIASRVKSEAYHHHWPSGNMDGVISAINGICDGANESGEVQTHSDRYDTGQTGRRV